MHIGLENTSKNDKSYLKASNNSIGLFNDSFRLFDISCRNSLNSTDPFRNCENSLTSRHRSPSGRSVFLIYDKKWQKFQIKPCLVMKIPSPRRTKFWIQPWVGARLKKIKSAENIFSNLACGGAVGLISAMVLEKGRKLISRKIQIL